MHKKKVVIFSLIMLLALISFYFDNQIIVFFYSLRSNLITDLLLGLTFASSEMIIFAFSTAILFLFKQKRKWIFPMWTGIIFSEFVAFLLKSSIQRQRPFQLGLIEVVPALEKASHFVWNFSFPSAQTMVIFSVVPILSKEFPRLRGFWFLIAFLVGLSRVYFGLHFMSDVIVGGLIGYLIGIIIINKEEENHYLENIFKKVLKR